MLSTQRIRRCVRYEYGSYEVDMPLLDRTGRVWTAVTGLSGGKIVASEYTILILNDTKGIVFHGEYQFEVDLRVVYNRNAEQFLVLSEDTVMVTHFIISGYRDGYREFTLEMILYTDTDRCVTVFNNEYMIPHFRTRREYLPVKEVILNWDLTE